MLAPATIRCSSYLLVAIAAITAALSFAATPASAAEAYKVEAYDCSNTGSGGFDAAGVFYLPCGTKVRRWDSAGKRLADIETGRTLRHAKPSGDGRYIFYQSNYDLYRMSRRDDGSYVNDNRFDPDPIVVAPSGCNPTGVYEPRGRGLATDHIGGLYVSVGGWINCSPNLIAKYDNHGTLLTVFGDYGDALGQFRTNMGIAASRDGRMVYTVENSNSRVQRFDWHPDGSYRFALTWGQVDDIHCSDGNFAAPYDVGLDPWGYVYVADTTCRRMQKFTATGQHLYSSGALHATTRPHGIAVDTRGNAILAEVKTRLVRTTPTPGPWAPATPLPDPDTEAPVLVGITAPAVTNDQMITVGLTATDDNAVVEVRLANEDGEWGDWKPFGQVVAHNLTDGHAIKAVFVQVRDAAENVSNVETATIRFEPAVDITAPEIQQVQVPDVAWAQSVDVAVSASDDIGVTEVRFANEDGEWADWKPFAAAADQPMVVPHILSPGFGPKGIYVQVRDASWNHSEIVFRALAYADPLGQCADCGGGDEPPIQDAADPVLVSATIPAITPTHDVEVLIEATDDTGVTGVRLANEDGIWTDWQPFAAAVSHQLTAGAGFKAVFVQVRDGAGRESETMLLRTQVAPDAPPPPPPGIVDLEAPVLHAIAVPAIVADRAIAIGIDATDDVGVVQVRTANEDGNWGPWRELANPLGHTLSADYGAKGVYLQVRDAAGRESAVRFERLTYALDAPPAPDPDAPVDAAAPSLNAIDVPAATNLADMEIGIDATDDVGVAQARTANEDGEWGPWRAFADPLAHTLSAGLGTKGVYVQVRDASGKESAVIFRTLRRIDADQPPAPVADNQAPVLIGVELPAITATREIEVRTTATDNIGIATMRFANEDGEWLPWQPWAAATTHQLSANAGPKAVYVQVRDAAGNESGVLLLRLTYAP